MGCTIPQSDIESPILEVWLKEDRLSNIRARYAQKADIETFGGTDRCRCMYVTADGSARVPHTDVCSARIGDGREVRWTRMSL